MPKWVPSWQAHGGSAREAISCVVPGRSVRASLAIVLLVPHLVGCFQHVPASQSAVTSGTEVSVGISDRGRVALSEPVGPGVRRIDGQVLEHTDTSMVLAVTSVQFLDLNVPMRWDGERVEVSRDFITDLRERRLSRSRSVIAAALVTAVVLVISLIAIRGFGGDEPVERPPPGNGDPV